MTNKTQFKHSAQDEIMTQISNTLVSYQNSQSYLEASDQERLAIETEIKKQADRVAKLFGFEGAWFN